MNECLVMGKVCDHVHCCVWCPEEQARNRFQSELEFIQCLANPNYLNCELFVSLHVFMRLTAHDLKTHSPVY